MHNTDHHNHIIQDRWHDVGLLCGHVGGTAETAIGFIHQHPGTVGAHLVLVEIIARCRRTIMIGCQDKQRILKPGLFLRFLKEFSQCHVAVAHHFAHGYRTLGNFPIYC